MILIIAVSINTNDQVVPLVQAVVPTENEFWWVQFCTFLEQTFEKRDSANSVLISDRDKGLITTIESYFPKVYPAYYCQHITDNIQSRYRAKCRPLFWKYTQAKTTAEFQVALEELKIENKEAAKYINNIRHALWARYAFPGFRFSHFTSNIVELLNSAQDRLRFLPVLKMLDSIWSTVMKQFYERQYRTQASIDLMNTLYLKLRERVKNSR